MYELPNILAQSEGPNSISGYLFQKLICVVFSFWLPIAKVT